MAVFSIQQTPQTIRGIRWWFQSDYPGGFQTAQPADATAISNLANLGGSTMVCSQAAGGNQPLFKQNINGIKAAILFDGSNDGFTLTGDAQAAASTRISSTSVFTLVFVFRTLAIGAAQIILGMRGSVSTNKVTIAISSAGELFSSINNGANIISSTPFTDTTKPHIVMMTSDGTGNIAQYLDGVLSAGTTATLATNGSGNNVAIGSSGTFTSPFNGYLFMGGFCSHILDSNERATLTQFIANNEGIAI